MFLNQNLTPKIAPEGQNDSPERPKKCKGGPKCSQIKNKKKGLYFQNQRWLSI